MGALSLTKSNRLFWLGRYTERVFTTLQYLLDRYDKVVDGLPIDHAAFCCSMGIGDCYRDDEDFVRRYLFDTEDPSSVLNSMYSAYDNAVVLRDTLSSITLSYIEMALSALKKAAKSDGPALQAQWVIDDIMAFRGASDDFIYDENSRNILKCGTSVERIDLYLRIEYRVDRIPAEMSRLLNRLYKTKLATNPEDLDTLVQAVLEKPDRLSNVKLISCIEDLFQV
ncbi:MAG: alpha-E domain-containing protein [Oscillospiraceae bacterium]|jgi:uncharacterized alpha-E superfamily protein|nr:alpha-E domain-containing protein [Oscillospiraceae bacterium]MDD3260486.1 alpha-E domain-containing protein [Oscillospiraceae bacterium]